MADWQCGRPDYRCRSYAWARGSAASRRARVSGGFARLKPSMPVPTCRAVSVQALRLNAVKSERFTNCRGRGENNWALLVKDWPCQYFTRDQIYLLEVLTLCLI